MGVAGSLPQLLCQEVRRSTSVFVALHPAWRDARGVHLVSMPNDSPEGFSVEWRSWDPATGGEGTRRQLPAQFFYGAASSPAGVAVALVSQVKDKANQLFAQRLVFFSADPALAPRVVDSPWEPLEQTHTEPFAVSWDGEAFQLTAVSSEGFWVQRYDEQGMALGDPVLVSEGSGPIQQDTYSITTDPVTGHTWFAGGTSKYTLAVAGWDRALASLLPEGKTRYQKVAEGGPCWFFNNPSLATDAEGFLLTGLGLDDTCVVRDRDDVFSVTSISQRFYSSPGTTSTLSYTYTSSTRVGEGWLAVGATVFSLFLWHLADDGTRLDESVLLTLSLCPPDQYCPHVMGGFSDVDLFQGEGEVWLSFQDASAAFLPGGGTYQRLIRIAPGCVYQSMYDILSQEAPAP
jgi:hypothetical protein